MKDFIIGGAVGTAILAVVAFPVLLSTARAGDGLGRTTPWPTNVRRFTDQDNGVVCYYTQRDWSYTHAAMVNPTLSCVKL